MRWTDMALKSLLTSDPSRVISRAWWHFGAEAGEHLENTQNRSWDMYIYNNNNNHNNKYIYTVLICHYLSDLWLDHFWPNIIGTWHLAAHCQANDVVRPTLRKTYQYVSTTRKMFTVSSTCREKSVLLVTIFYAKCCWHISLTKSYDGFWHFGDEFHYI